MSFFESNHYSYLERYLPRFLNTVAEVFGAETCAWRHNRNIISSHGDKCFQYRRKWERMGISFVHGSALYLLTHCYPFCLECRSTPEGWVSPEDWVIDNYWKFKAYLP